MTDLKDVIWRIREKFPVDHAELLDLADRIEALTAENERLRAALTTAKNALNLLSHGEGDDYRMEWLEETLVEIRAALGDTQ